MPEAPAAPPPPTGSPRARAPRGVGAPMPLRAGATRGTPGGRRGRGGLRPGATRGRIDRGGGPPAPPARASPRSDRRRPLPDPRRWTPAGATAFGAGGDVPLGP